MRAAIPNNESARLEALRRYEILDTADELVYDDLVNLATTICGTRMGAISFVDDCRMWFKARRGIDFREADRDLSLCAHAILRSEQVLVVPDTEKDPRFSDNDLVKGRAQFRFYAGAPLINPEGLAIGTICVIDNHPKPISAAQVEALRALSRQVVSLLELRRSNRAIRDQADALMKAREEAKAASRAKSIFLANISHEIRTPMNGVVGVTSLLNATPLSDRQRHYVETIEKSAEGLLNVLSNVLDFAKNENGSGETHPATLDLPQFIEDIASMMRPMAIAKQLRFIASVDEELHRPLVGDLLCLQQLVSNLIGNALKFTSQGTVEVSVSMVSEERNAMTVRFEIRDTGIGIARDRQKSIFEEFTQVDQGTQRRFGGAGLGLSICRQLATKMNTVVEVRSEIGVGSTFWFDLKMPFKLEESSIEPELFSTVSEHDRRLPRVLVAEDNEVNSLVVTSMLEHNGCEVVCVQTGEEVLRVLENESFDLIFMDVQMPRMDGIQATRAVRAMTGPVREIPIIALTASVLKEDALMCQLAGMNDFISKPINERVISGALKRWIVRRDIAMS
jgi:signal transduction histidine kinase/ActR/RegA family two-component response regulator